MMFESTKNLPGKFLESTGGEKKKPSLKIYLSNSKCQIYMCVCNPYVARIHLQNWTLENSNLY